MNSFESYVLYQSLKLHFKSEKYDFFKYNGTMKSLKYETFEKKKDKYFYYKLSNHLNPKMLIVSNILHDEKKSAWIGNIMNSEGYRIYLNWLKKYESFSYLFRQDLEKIDNLKDWLKQKEDDMPFILTKVRQGDIMIETVVVLNRLLNFFEGWKTNNILLNHDLFLYKKYDPFLNLDMKKYSLIVKDVFMKM